MRTGCTLWMQECFASRESLHSEKLNVSASKVGVCWDIRTGYDLWGRKRFVLGELKARNLRGLYLEGRSPISERSVPNSRFFAFRSRFPKKKKPPNLHLVAFTFFKR